MCWAGLNYLPVYLLIRLLVCLLVIFIQYYDFDHITCLECLQCIVYDTLPVNQY